MQYIKDIILNYLFLFILFGLLEIMILKYYKTKDIIIKPGFIIGYQIIVLLLIGIYTITGIPGINTLVLHDFKQMNLILYLENIFSFECVMNMIMFIPLGMIIPLLWRNAQKLYITIMNGLCFSLFIELSQLFSYRASDINDILTNTIGTILGYMIYRIFLSKIHVFELDDKNKSSQLHSFFQITMITFVYFIIGSPILSLIHGF